MQPNITKRLWISERQLGTIQILRHRGSKISYRLPVQIENSITLRFKGHGEAKNNQVGDLMLHVQVDRGGNLHDELWVSETEARNGCHKKIGRWEGFWKKVKSTASVPHSSREGSVIRIRNLGYKTRYQWGMPFANFFNRPRGDLILKLRVFPERIIARYRHVDARDAESLSLEGWVYRNRDEILKTLGRSISRYVLGASSIADSFNCGGWRAVAEALEIHLRVRHFGIQFEAISDLAVPGQHQKIVKTTNYGSQVISHKIKIRSEFLNDPFATTAILAHEICHVIEDRLLAQRGARLPPSGKEVLELERRVDLLVFLYQLGEFQLRVARQSQMTFGYFNQEIFERMYVILQLDKKTT